MPPGIEDASLAREQEDSIPARYWQRQSDGRIMCDLCPHACTLQEKERAACSARFRVGEELRATYGRVAKITAEPVERMPLAHFRPGAMALAVGTAGCNLACRSCDVWHESTARKSDTLARRVSPFDLPRLAQQRGCDVIAFTHNDPIATFEYTVDALREGKAQGLATVVVTAGYIHPEPRRELLEHADAVVVPLKAFLGQAHEALTRRRLEPVLETIKYVYEETNAWLEIVNLLVPGANDSETEVSLLAAWILDELDAGVPLHFSALTPDAELSQVRPTPFRTIAAARDVAIRGGVRYVYSADIADEPTGSTYCYGCGQKLISRNVYRASNLALAPGGQCRACGRHCAGVWE